MLQALKHLGPGAILLRAHRPWHKEKKLSEIEVGDQAEIWAPELGPHLHGLRVVVAKVVRPGLYGAADVWVQAQKSQYMVGSHELRKLDEQIVVGSDVETDDETTGTVESIEENGSKFWVKLPDSTVRTAYKLGELELV